MKLWNWIKTAALKGWKAWNGLDKEQRDQIKDAVEDVADKIIKK